MFVYKAVNLNIEFYFPKWLEEKFFPFFFSGSKEHFKMSISAKDRKWTLKERERLRLRDRKKTKRCKIIHYLYRQWGWSRGQCACLILCQSEFESWNIQEVHPHISNVQRKITNVLLSKILSTKSQAVSKMPSTFIYNHETGFDHLSINVKVESFASRRKKLLSADKHIRKGGSGCCSVVHIGRFPSQMSTARIQSQAIFYNEPNHCSLLQRQSEEKEAMMVHL